MLVWGNCLCFEFCVRTVMVYMYSLLKSYYHISSLFLVGVICLLG